MAGDRGELAGTALLLDDDRGQTMRGPGDLDLLLGRVGGVVATEHEHLIGVLMVGDEDLAAALAGHRQQREEVAVVPELTGLGLRGLLRRVEGGHTAQDGLAPADDDVLRVSVRDGHGVGGVRRDGVEPQTTRTAAEGTGPLGRRGGLGGLGLRRGKGGGGAHGGGSGDDGGGAQRRTAADGLGDHVTHVRIRGGVGHFVETGVTTPEPAGQGGPTAGMRVTVRSDDRQLNAHDFFVLPLLPLECSVGDGRGTFVRERGDCMNWR